MTVSANIKRGWLHHPLKESICLNIGSKEYNSALDNGYVKNLTDIKEIGSNEDIPPLSGYPTDEDLIKDADSILTEIEDRGLNFLEEIKKFESGEKYLNPCKKEEEKIKELEASLKEREQSEEEKIKELEASAKRIAELEASLEDSAKKIKELEASLKEKKQTKKV